MDDDEKALLNYYTLVEWIYSSKKQDKFVMSIICYAM